MEATIYVVISLENGSRVAQTAQSLESAKALASFLRDMGIPVEIRRKTFAEKEISQMAKITA